MTKLIIHNKYIREPDDIVKTVTYVLINTLLLILFISLFIDTIKPPGPTHIGMLMAYWFLLLLLITVCIDSLRESFWSIYHPSPTLYEEDRTVIIKSKYFKIEVR